VPRAWLPGDLVAWDPAGVRPTGKTGVGAWALAADEASAWGEVDEYRPVSTDGHEGLLTVRTFRTQS
jgi:hypothetical protein